MKYYMGMDHGTTAVSFQLIDENKDDVAYFSLNRDKLSNNEENFKDALCEHVNPKDINLLAMTYAMGDNINKIIYIDKVQNKGIKSINGAGKVTGGGSNVYDEIVSMNIPSVLIPGLHSNCTFLDDRFRASYSHCASSEKVSLTYYAYKKTGWNNMIISDISSNTVSILVEDAKIRGAVDACIGAMGFIHGPLDLNMIRDIDDGKRSANECFSRAGISKIANIDAKVSDTKDLILDKVSDGDEDALLAVESLIMSVVMEIYGLYGISESDIDGIVLTGSGGCMTSPVDISGKIKSKIERIAPVEVLTPKSGALGSCLIAYDIFKNRKKNIMGIDVDYDF